MINLATTKKQIGYYKVFLRELIYVVELQNVGSNENFLFGVATLDLGIFKLQLLKIA